MPPAGVEELLAGSCAGCSAPASIVLDSVQLLQSDSVGYNPVIVPRHLNGRIYWQRVTAPGPVITSFSPAGGPPGTVVRLHGTGFTSTSRVAFGNVTAAFSVMADSILDATAPASASTAPIQATNAFASGSSDSDFVQPPVVNSFVPAQAPTGHAVYLWGRELLHIRSVTFAGAAAAFAMRSDTSLAATVPAGASDGPIVVTNPGGTATTGTFHVGPVTAVGDPIGDGVSLGAAAPNPFAGSTRWTLSLPARTHVAGMILDARGARVTGLIDADWSAGRHSIVWEGRDTHGAHVRPGVYFLRIDAGSRSWRRTVIVLR